MRLLTPRHLALAAPLAAALTLAGCDNPACVFGPGGCRTTPDIGPGSGGGAFDAVFPGDPAWIAPAAPTVVRVAPGTTGAHPQSPLVVEFDQSLDPASLAGAFELLETTTLLSTPLVDPPALVGDGRVVILSPAVPLLNGGQYSLAFATGQEIHDVNGQAFDYGANQQVLQFAVTASGSSAPRVLYTFPEDGEARASDVTEVTVVFDRIMDATTFDSDSFAATVDGAAPTFTPVLTSLLLTGGPQPIPVLSVWRWLPVDGMTGRRATFGASADVRFTLSPSANPLSAAMGGGNLPTFEFSFDTSALRAPSAVAKLGTALPPDAIGRPNLTGGDFLEVSLRDPAQAGDVLDVFVFGSSAEDPNRLIALTRSAELTGGETTVPLGEGDLDLLDDLGDQRFSDGELEFMVRQRRGLNATIARGTDVDPFTPGAQHLVLDLTAPQLLGLGTSGAALDSFTSQLGGVVIVGRGDEELRYARVDAGALGTNVAGPLDPPPTAFSAADGLFVAAPVAAAPAVLDPLAPAVTYTVTVFDRALNPATMQAVGTYTQLGAVGPGASFGTVDVRVFDAGDDGLLDGALVIAHEEAAGVVTTLGSATTTMGGAATVPSAMSGDTLVTVQLAGYDSFTFHGVPSARIDVPLVRAATTSARIEGAVRGPIQVNLGGNLNRVVDSRFARPGDLFGAVMMCGLSGTGLQRECPYGPLAVRAQRTGFTSFFSTDPTASQSEVAGDRSRLLRAWSLTGPSAPLGYGETAFGVDLELTFPQLVTATPPNFLRSSTAPGLGALAGPPQVTIEARAVGLPDPITVGVAGVFSTGPAEWLVLGAQAGEADVLALRGAIDDDFHIRAELRDTAGNRVGARPRESTTGGDVLPLDVAGFLVPGPAGLTGGDSYNLEIANVITDASGDDGLYRVIVTDPTGARWHLWTLDAPDAAGDLLLSLPPVATSGGTPLADGAQTAQVSAWSWAGLDRTRFLWSDVARLHEAYSHTFPVPFEQD